ncbi:MAG: CDP-alcohol phosphatidyltransferase family protein [Candidatus Saccharicenans sp.]
MLAEQIEKKGYLIADSLTALRALIALRLAYILWQGKAALDSFMVLIFAAWLSDCLDGYFARKSGREGHLAEADGWVDWAVYIISLLYGTVLGRYSWTFFGIFVTVNILSFWLSRSIHVNQAFHFLYILLGFRTVWLESIFWRRFFLIWVAGVIFFKRHRLKVQIQEFLAGWNHLLTGRRKNQATPPEQ